MQLKCCNLDIYQTCIKMYSITVCFGYFFLIFLSYLLLKTMGCFSGRLMSSASEQKSFRAVCSAFKCSFDEFVREKVVSQSYSSAIFCFGYFKVTFETNHNMSQYIYKDINSKYQCKNKVEYMSKSNLYRQYIYI